MSQLPDNDATLAAVEVPEDLPEDCGLSYDPLRTRLGVVTLSVLERDAIEFLKSQNLEPEDQKRQADAMRESAHSVFRLKTRVGQGGFGEVWEATQQSLQRVVAVKRLRKDLLDETSEEDRKKTKDALERSFRQEALTTANLSHPNIVPVYELGADEEGAPLIAMKLIRGKPWDEMIADDAQDMTPADFLAKHIPILVQVTQAVAFAHSRGVVHRDLKPSQVIVGEFGEVLLADWGLAVVFDEALLLQTDETLSGTFLPTPGSSPSPAGTPAFMAPEQTEKHSRLVGPWTDVYLLGGTLYFLLTFRRPHDADSARESFMKARLGDVFPPERAAPNRRVPKELARLAMEAMEPAIDKRMQSASEFLDRLQDYLSGTSRRKESRILTEAAARRLAQPGADYAQYVEALALIDRAITLWGQNPLGAELREKAGQALCLKALKHRDLVLARLQMENMADGPVKERLRGRVETAELWARRRDRQRRVAVILAGILALIVVIVSNFYNYQLDSERDLVIMERDDARKARDSARDARDDAHQLVNFMMTDLLASLEGSPMLEPLRRVGDESIAYFQSLSPTDRTEQTEHQYAEALLTNGFVYKSLGDSTKALERFREYRDVKKRLYDRSPNDHQAMMELAYSHVLIGMLMNERGDQDARGRGMAGAVALAAEYIARASDVKMPAPMPEEELLRFAQFLRETEDKNLLCRNPDAMINVADAMINWNAGDPNWVNGLTYLYTWTGESFLSENTPEQAARMFDKALAWRQKVADSMSPAYDVEYAIFSDYRGLGLALEGMGEYENAIDVYTDALELAKNAGPRSRQSPRQSESWRQGELNVRRSLATSLLKSGKTEEALEEGNKALGIAQKAAEESDRNAQMKRQLFVTWHTMGRIYEAKGDLDKARDGFEQGIEISSKLVRQDPLNTFWRSDAVDLMSDYMALADRMAEDRAENVGAQMRDYARRVAKSLPEAPDAQGQSVRQALIEVCY